MLHPACLYVLVLEEKRHLKAYTRENDNCPLLEKPKMYDRLLVQVTDVSLDFEFEVLTVLSIG